MYMDIQDAGTSYLLVSKVTIKRQMSDSGNTCSEIFRFLQCITYMGVSGPSLLMMNLSMQIVSSQRKE